jgi:hypothetical protein
MGFLDNLENNLKALESREEKDAEQQRREADAREAARTEALKRAPYAEELKSGPFTSNLLTACRSVGHRARVLVQFTWIDQTLRLDAGSRRLELRPTSEGVEAVFFENGRHVATETADLHGDPEAFARRWLTPEP